jgi:hypothetical protein
MKQLLLIVALLMVGCGSTGVVRMTTADISPKPKDCNLDVYDSEADVKRKFVVLCRIDAETGRTLFHRHSMEAAMDRMRPKACECGADAVILLDAKKQGAMSSFSAGYGYSNLKVKAIRYTK